MTFVRSDRKSGSVASLDPSSKQFSDRIPVGTTQSHGSGCDPIWLAVGGHLAAGETLMKAIAVGRLLTNQLFGITPSDPLTLVGAVVSMLIVAVAGSYLPARRATAVAPIEALRTD